MKKTIYITIYIISLLTISIPMWSQGGSNYSIFGIGDITYGHTSASQGMGGCQIGYASDNTISIFNPALWSKIRTTRVQTGYRFNQNIINNSEKTLLQNNGALNGFYSIFNFDTTREISVGLMLQPISSVNYYMSSQIDPNDTTLGINGNILYRGAGGLSNLTLGVGTKIIKGLYLGASLSATLGRIDHSSITNITNTNTTNYQIHNTNIISGLNSNIGIYIEPISNLGIGAFYNIAPKAQLEDRYEYLYDPIISSIRDTVVINNSDIYLPSFFGVGVSYKFTKILLAVDYLQGNFKDVNINSAGNEFNNSNRIGVGAIVLGSPNPYSSLINRTSYKLGAYTEKLYYNVAGKQINEYGITGGIQFPISRTAQIDFSVILGRRGTLDNGLLQETFGKIIIDVSIGDNWFKPIKKEF